MHAIDRTRSLAISGPRPAARRSSTSISREPGQGSREMRRQGTLEGLSKFLSGPFTMSERSWEAVIDVVKLVEDSPWRFPHPGRPTTHLPKPSAEQAGRPRPSSISVWPYAPHRLTWEHAGTPKAVARPVGPSHTFLSSGGNSRSPQRLIKMQEGRATWQWPYAKFRWCPRRSASHEHPCSSARCPPRWSPPHPRKPE